MPCSSAMVRKGPAASFGAGYANTSKRLINSASASIRIPTSGVLSRRAMPSPMHHPLICRRADIRQAVGYIEFVSDAQLPREIGHN